MSNTILWIDTETTGLDPTKDYLLEVAAIVTDWDLNILEEPFLEVVRPTGVLVGYLRDVVANDYVREMHDRTGLWRRVADTYENEFAVERKLYDYIRAFTQGKPPLGGNSITHDRNFLKTFMPQAYTAIHYRSIDVSSIAQLADKWYGIKYEKQKNHAALDDIKESIEELKYIRNNIMPSPAPTFRY